MTIAIAGHFVQRGRVGGAEHMLYNLLRGMRAHGAATYLLCSALADLDPCFVEEMSGASTAIAPQGHWPNRFIGEQISCLKPLRADAILFPNYFTPPLVPHRLGRVVTVIHDLQYIQFPEITPPARLRWLQLTHRLTFARADKVVVPSEFVRNEIAQHYGNRAAEKTVAIHNPISWNRFPDDRAPAPPGRPYILSVAAHYPHKNLAVLIEALALIRKSADVRLVLIGQLPRALLGVKDRSRDPSALVHELGLTDYVEITGYVDDRTLGRYYRHARAFAFPSLYEGFGMPAVEAMGFGIPTVTTRCASLPEVTMGAAIYVENATDPCAWASALIAAMERTQPHDSSQRIRDAFDPVRIAGLYLTQCQA